MAAFGGLIITHRGRALQAKAQIGTQLVFTRIAVGNGDLGGSSILDLTALRREVKSLPITKIKTLSGGKAVLGAILSNQDITQGFYLREIGVFAQDPDLGEILYCYGNAGAIAEYIPAGGGPDIIEKNIDIIILVGNASSVSAVIDESLIFETPDGAQEKVDTHAVKKQTHGISEGYYIAKTSRSDQLPAWEDIQEKPSSFPPSAHTHAGSDITSKVASAAAADTVPWSGVSGKPSSFPPSAHKSTHASGGSDALSPADIGAAAASDLTSHLADNMPHRTTDTVTGKVYRWGLAIQNGEWGILYEEVVL